MEQIELTLELSTGDKNTTVMSADVYPANTGVHSVLKLHPTATVTVEHPDGWKASYKFVK